MKNKNLVNVGAVHTHTHTHTIQFNEINKEAKVLAFISDIKRQII